MDSDSSFEDIEGDYLRMCEERRSNLVSRDTEDHLPIIPQPIPPPVVPTVVPPLVSVSNTMSERTDTSSGSSMSYPSIKEEDNLPTSMSTETQMETKTSTPAVVVVTIKLNDSVSATPIPADLLALPSPAAEFAHKKPSVNLPLVSDDQWYVEVKEDQDLPLCLIPSCSHSYTEGYPLMPVGRQGKFLYKKLRIQSHLPVSHHFIFESINDTLFFSHS